MDPPTEEIFGEEVMLPPLSATAAIAAVGMLSCSSSESSSNIRHARASSTDDRQDFQTHVEAVQHGHRGLEAALGAMCDRLLDLEGLVEKTQEDQESTEVKYRELRQECLDRHHHLSGVNDTLRHELSLLESRLEDMAQAQIPHAEKEQETLVREVAPNHDTALTVMAAAATEEAGIRSSAHTEEVAAMREELHALKRKVDIIAANVLGEAENVIMDITAGTVAAESSEAKLQELEPRGKAGRDNATSPADETGTVGNDAVSIDSYMESKSESQQETTGEGGTPQQGDEDDAIGNSVVLPRCVRARNRWVMVRMHRAFLVKKIRRQVMAERKVSQSETIFTRVERLEKALGVNVYTRGSGRLGVLAREVRLSLAMIVEHQARAASDNLSAPLCLFPAHPGDLSLISRVDFPSQPDESSRASCSKKSVETSAREDSHNGKYPRSSVGLGSSDRDCDESGASGRDVHNGDGRRKSGNSSGEGWSLERDAEVGDEGRLWMTEDGGYLCVDLLLKRTLEELVEGLAFATSRLELGKRLSRVSTPWSSGGASIGISPSSKHASCAMGDAMAASTKQLRMLLKEEEEGNIGSVTKLKKEFERMQDRCTRLGALVARLRSGAAAQQPQQQPPEQPGEERTVPHNTEQNAGDRRQPVAFAADESEDDPAAVRIPQRTAATAAVTSEVLRLSCALAGDLQYLLSRPAYCRVLDTFSFTPERKCLCGRDFGAAGNASATPATPAPTATTRTTATNAAFRGGDDHENDGSCGVVGGGGGATIASATPAGDSNVTGGGDGGGLPEQRCQQKQEDQTEHITVSVAQRTRGDPGGDRKANELQRSQPQSSAVPTPQKQVGGERRVSGGECFGDAESGGGRGLDNEHGFRVRPTLYQCFVLSLSHLSSFLTTARSRSAHRAVSTLKRELERDVLSAKAEVGKAVTAAAKARKGAREASAEALAATARAASAAASARNEGSFLLEELHAQLAKAMQNERDRLEANNEERARAERERVGQVLETQLGHLKSLLDTKAGQEDLTSIARAMGEVEETLTTVRESIPGEHALLELQEALSRKADKAYTKRKMSLLVSRVSALLKEESDEPSMAKKCLSCDRTFNKFSFADLELAQQLPDVLDSVEDAEMRAQQQQQQHRLLGGTGGPGDGPYGRGGGGRGGDGREGGLPRETATDSEVGGGMSRSLGGGGTRPGSAPSARPRTPEPRTFDNTNRPSSAAPPRRLGGADGAEGRGSIRNGVGYRREKGNAFGGGFRPGSGGARARTTRGVGARATTPIGNFLPPAASGSGGQLTSRQSQLLAPAALSAAYGPLSDGARKAVEAEAARAERLSAIEPGPAPDNIRYGGMTQAPLVRQLFAGLGGGTASNGSGSSFARAKAGVDPRDTIGNGMFVGGAEGHRGVEGKGRGRGARGRGGERVQDSARAGGRGDGGRAFGSGGERVQDSARAGGRGDGGRAFGSGDGSWKQRRAAAAAASAADERPPSAGSRGGVHEGFASALEHHRRNVIAVTVPPVQSVGAAGLVPETLVRRSNRGGSSGGGSSDGRGGGGDLEPDGA